MLTSSLIQGARVPPAAEYGGQIPESVKRDRSARLIAEKNRVRDELLSEVVREGRALSCIFESREGEVYTAHSDSYIEVRVTSDEELSGKLIDVIPERAENGIIYGKLAK